MPGLDDDDEHTDEDIDTPALEEHDDFTEEEHDDFTKNKNYSINPNCLIRESFRINN